MEKVTKVVEGFSGCVCHGYEYTQFVSINDKKSYND